MAAATPLQNLLEEATCPICLGPFKDPVITPCVHHFCRSCITGWSPETRAPLRCPQCREPCSLVDLKPNRQLQSMVELLSQLSAQSQSPPLEGGVCGQHEEKLKLFCQDDNKLICVICQVSREHEKHRVRPISEAAQDYQGKLQIWLPPLQKERDTIVMSKQKEEDECKALRGNLQAERTKTTAEFEGLRQLLKEQEQTILKRLEEMDRKITMMENANIAKLSNQISSLNNLIKEIETKCQQPPEELLKDVGLTLSRCENVRFREPQLKIKKSQRKDDNFKTCGFEPFTGKFSPNKQNPLKPEDIKQYKVSVTLDPETAHKSLALSEEGRRVRSSVIRLFRRDYPGAFTVSPCVLGKEGFSSGKHYWEVQLLQEGLGWAVGVAIKSVNRHIDTELYETNPYFSDLWRGSKSVYPYLVPIESLLEGIWAVHLVKGQYFALTSPRIALKPRQPPKKLGVYLDYEGGQVSLYNGDTMELLYTFRGASFDEPVHPYFNLCETNYANKTTVGQCDLRLV